MTTEQINNILEMRKPVKTHNQHVNNALDIAKIIRTKLLEEEIKGDSNVIKFQKFFR